MPNIRVVRNLEEALSEADGVILLVGHSEFKTMDADLVGTIMEGRVAVDTVNGWNVDAWEEAGFELFRLGVGGAK